MIAYLINLVLISFTPAQDEDVVVDSGQVSDPMVSGGDFSDDEFEDWENPGEFEEFTSDESQVSLEALMNIDLEVTTVSKRAQSASRAAAAIHVLSEKDIRRSGLKSIPELLRMVPGLHVVRISSSVWGVSSRGFTAEFSNKMLVLIDGRSVYTPLFSGVFWDIQDVMIEDIARIEVIRGPGAALWGANAVNGVINIITKSARETTGTLLSVTVGNEDKHIVAARYGAIVDEDFAFRVFGKVFSRDGLYDSSDTGLDVTWRQARGGFRGDWTPSDEDSFSFSTEVYEGVANEVANIISKSPPGIELLSNETLVAGGHLLARWERELSQNSSFVFQSYFDHTQRDDLLIREDRTTFDVDFQHRTGLGETSEFTWGTSYRSSSPDIRDTEAIGFEDLHSTDRLYTGFIHFETDLCDDVRLIAGTKLEHNDYTEFEVQPSLRVSYELTESSTLWGSVSRAVRTPSQVEHDVMLPLLVIPGDPFPTIIEFRGDESYNSEELIAYEIGYRTRPMENFSFDISAFVNDYDSLRTSRFGEVEFNGSAAILPIYAGNDLRGITYGAELSSQFKATEWCELNFGYAYLDVNLHHTNVEESAFNGEDAEEKNPRHQFHVRSSFDLSESFELDTAVYFVDDLRALSIDKYVRADVRLGFNPTEQLRLSLGVQGIFHDEEPEFGPEAGSVTIPYGNQAAVYFSATLAF